VLLEGGPDLLPAFPAKLRAASRRSLERLGVEVMTGAMVVDVDADGVAWRPTSAGARPPAGPPAGGQPVEAQRISAQTILWAAGVAASPLAKSLGVPLDRIGRATPTPTLALAEHPEIFVVGDMCAFTQDGTLLPGVAQVAMQQGAQAAKNILHAVAHESLEPFRYKNYGNMATIGRGAAVADIGPVEASGFLAWLFWLFLHIFWLIGFRNRLAVISEWAWAYLTFQRRVRLITGEKLWPG
jgi:NADH dehydrogenase